MSILVGLIWNQIIFKVMNKCYKSFLLAIMILGGISCQKNPVGTDVPSTDTIPTESYSGFDFKTVKDYNITIKTLNPQNQAFQGVYVALFYKNPLNTDGTLKPEASDFKIFHGITDANGVLTSIIAPPTYSDSVYALILQSGLPNLTAAALNSPSIIMNIGGSPQNIIKQNSTSQKAAFALPNPSKVNGYYVLGTWSNQGVPNYLVSPNDIITSTFLNDVSASLPEGKPLTTTHPQYLTNTLTGNLVLQENCNIWVTFIGEGAGWTNALGYYTYSNGNAPANASAIADKTIIFPNTSLVNSGGGLNPGNKVMLLYYNPSTKTYQDYFPSGITVSWFLIAQGWSGGTVKAGAFTDYSDPQYNLESDVNLKKHNVLLYNSSQNLLLLGFEDMRRDQGSDNDFNDAIFYTTVNPITAINTSDYQKMDSAKDTDGDGVSDSFDEYPTDSKRAFNNYYPAKDVYGTLVYEDLWPFKGDYDFNDLVVDYNINQITNAKNEVVDAICKISVRAIGASYHNAFGILFKTPASNIAAISGQKNTKGYLNIASNGTENGVADASVIFFDDAYNVLPYPGSGLYVNTDPTAQKVSPQSQTVTINFTTPVPISTLGTPPYNPFIIVNRDRGVEVHLPNQQPTPLARVSLLGTGQDKSVPAQNKYYVSDYYLPWALNLPAQLAYPAEKRDIRNAYLHFNDWAKSQGSQYKDWYSNTGSGYRNTSNIYSK